jgi:hypothetical protein
LLGPSSLKLVGRSTVEQTKGEAPELHVMERKIRYQAVGPHLRHVVQGCWMADGRWLASMEKPFVRVRLDVGQRFSRCEVEIRRNQWHRGASDW